MPRITEYNAPDTRLTESPIGAAAWETAGRRIGPLLNSAGQDIRKEGQLADQEIKDQRWPLAFLALGKPAPLKIGFRVAGGVNNLQDSIDRQNSIEQYQSLGSVGAGASNIGGLIDEAMNEGGLPNHETIGQRGYDIAPGSLSPLDPWGNSSLSKGSANPNASAIAAANAWAYGNAKPAAQPPAGTGYNPPFGLNSDGTAKAPYGVGSDGRPNTSAPPPGVIGRIGTAIGDVLGKAPDVGEGNYY